MFQWAKDLWEALSTPLFELSGSKLSVMTFFTVGDVSGKVVDIQARSTLVQTRDDVSILIPNSQFISEQVVNESFSGHQIRYNVKVGVAYGSDTKKVKEILLEAARENSKVLTTPEPDVLFDDFGDSSLNLEFG